MNSQTPSETGAMQLEPWIATWAALNQQASPLDQKFKLTPHYELVDAALRAKIFEGEDPQAGWTRFHKRFPHAPGLLAVDALSLTHGPLHSLAEDAGLLVLAASSEDPLLARLLGITPAPNDGSLDAVAPALRD